MKLTLKQKKFADEYIISGNIEQSALKAGYSKTYSRCQSSKLLSNVGVKAYLDERLAKIDSEKIADAKEVMEYLTSVMRGESSAEIVVVEGTGDGCSQARRINKAPDEKERTKAAELLGKRYRLFTEKTDADEEQLQKLDKILDSVNKQAKEGD